MKVQTRAMQRHRRRYRKNRGRCLSNREIEELAIGLWPMGDVPENAPLLSPMRRASELGCPDFQLRIEDGKTVWDFALPDLISSMDNPIWEPIPNKDARFNRYAANICECWWREYWNAHPLEDHGKMIDLCRAFANEHGR